MEFERLSFYARQTLERNIIETSQGPFLRAGVRQFSSLWSRDFLYAVPGLLKIGRQDVVQNHILHLARSISEEGIVPRILAHRSSASQVLKWTVFKPISNLLWPQGEDQNWKSYQKLKPEIYGEHGTRALDSGLLLLLRYVENISLFPNEEALFQKVFSYYQKLTSDATELLRQEAYEDWQDSAKRAGKISYSNLLLLIVLKKFKSPRANIFEKMFFKTYLREDGLLAFDQQKIQISLETQLHFLQMAHEMKLKGDDSWNEMAAKMWSSLRQHSLWKIGPGIPIFPEYESSQISFFTKIVGLAKYHDGFLWTWLMAEAAKVCQLYGDFAERERILKALQDVSEKNKAIPEILNADLSIPDSAFYRSELSFSWGAGKCLEAIGLFPSR